MAKQQQEDPGQVDNSAGGQEDPTVAPQGFEPATAMEEAAEEMFGIAARLRDEKYDLLGRIDANRQSLRQFERMGALAESQAERLSRLYPVKRRRTGEEV